MAWNPNTDLKNRAFSGILTTLFPEQTKTLPRILVWSVIFFLDLILGASVAYHYGWFASGDHSHWRTAVLLVAIIAVFWVQGYIWNTITRLFR